MAYEIVDVEPVQKWDRKRKFYKQMRVFYTLNGIEYSKDVEIEDYEADKTDEIIKAEVARLQALIGKKK